MGYSHGVRPGKESSGESLRRILRTLLNADPRVVSRFLTELVDPRRVRGSNITAIYCRFVSQGQSCFAVEFVAGETIEQFAAKIDPEAGEQMVPLLSVVLDSFEKRLKDTSANELRAAHKLVRNAEGIELLDLGVIRALAAAPCAPNRGLLMIEGGRIKGPRIPGDGDLAGSLAVFAERKLSESFRCASIPGGISEIVISSVLFERESYCLPHVEQAPVSPRAVDPKVAPRSLSGRWIGIGIAAMLAGSTLISVLRRTPAHVGAPAVHAPPEAHRQLAPLEPAPSAREVPVERTPKRAAKRERRSFQPNIGSPKEETKKPDLVAQEPTPELEAPPPVLEEARHSDSALAEAAAAAATPAPVLPTEAATEQGATKKPGRLRRVIGKVFSLGRQKREGTLSRVPIESVAKKEE